MVKRYTFDARLAPDTWHVNDFMVRHAEGEWVHHADYDALKEQRDFAVRELEAILFMLQREKGKEEK
jgi:hypothetical protein